MNVQHKNALVSSVKAEWDFEGMEEGPNYFGKVKKEKVLTFLQ